MIKTQFVRCFSTRSIVDKWFIALQTKTHEEQQRKLVQCIEYSLQQNQFNYFHLIRDIVHRWAIEQPKTEALWTHQIDRNHSQKLTFHEIYLQSSQYANILTGSQFNLTPGKSVLIILPRAAKERILIEFACLINNLISYSYDPKYLNEAELRQQIRTSAIDCIITNSDCLKLIMSCTHNSFRPLKKALITDHSTSEPLPVGWHHLMYDPSFTEKKDSVQKTKLALRHLSSDNMANPSVQSMFSIRPLLIAYWLNLTQTPRLIWLKETNSKVSFAPWLLGSTIFYGEAENIEAMFETSEEYPIDTFCASEKDFQTLETHSQKNTHLQQLLSTEPINDSNVKSRWHSATNLHIRDCPSLPIDPFAVIDTGALSVNPNDQSLFKHK